MPRRMPRKPTRGSRTRRPTMALLDLLGRRWTLRILWELREARLTFRALQTSCGAVSPAVLNRRLRELRESHLVDLAEPEGYGLTPSGHELRKALQPLIAWSTRRARAAPTKVARRRGGSHVDLPYRASAGPMVTRRRLSSGNGYSMCRAVARPTDSPQ
jgi:DNA-binding HxlR family transcriptional regulator